MKNYKIVPSKRGQDSSHCSSMMKKTEKVTEISQFLSSLENCTINLQRFVDALSKLTKSLLKFFWWIYILLNSLSAL